VHHVSLLRMACLTLRKGKYPDRKFFRKGNCDEKFGTIEREHTKSCDPHPPSPARAKTCVLYGYPFPRIRVYRCLVRVEKPMLCSWPWLHQVSGARNHWRISLPGETATRQCSNDAGHPLIANILPIEPRGWAMNMHESSRAPVGLPGLRPRGPVS